MVDKSKRTTESSASPRVAGKMNRFAANSSATAAELSEFLSKMRGKNPQEVLGMVAASSLIQSTAVALGATVILMLVLTLIPAWTAGDKPVASAQSPQARQTADQNRNGQQQSKQASAKTPSGKGGGAGKEPSDADKAKTLGINGVKDPDKGKNPLDNLGDDIFKNIE